jgi:hypothetical protein
MARPATGQIVERRGSRGKTFAIRYTMATGERRQVRLGKEADGWTRARAHEELVNVLAEVRPDPSRGPWREPTSDLARLRADLQTAREALDRALVSYGRLEVAARGGSDG